MESMIVNEGFFQMIMVLKELRSLRLAPLLGYVFRTQEEMLEVIVDEIMELQLD